MPQISPSPIFMSFYQQEGKRGFDVFVAVAALVLLSPLLLVIAVAIYFGDDRPILFKQTRIGLGAQPFTILKFRTMSNLSQQTQFDLGSTSRVTGIGRLLRKSKLDELPQLINVLLGDMSIVGPRPEVPTWVEQFSERWERVLLTRPGITDSASIKYRNEEALLAAAADSDALYRNDIMPKKLSLYESYVENITFMNDMKIIAQTIKSVVKG